jgi:Flp pilus assembly protein TadG
MASLLGLRRDSEASMGGHPAGTPARASGDRGAALVEAALVSPIFFLILFGVLEFGGAFRDYLTVRNASQGGARAGAIAGNDADADFKVVNAVRTDAAAMPSSQVLRVVVYHAADPTDDVPAACTTASTGIGSPTSCNVYTGALLRVPDGSAWTDCTSPTDPSRFWCPADRKTAATAASGNGPPDYMGVWVQVKHPWVTGLFGQQIILTSQTITKLEARSVS